MLIKGRELNVREASVSESPYREDLTQLFLQATRDCPDLSIAAYGVSHEQLPHNFIPKGTNFNSGKYKAAYTKILKDVYGETDEEFYNAPPCFPYDTGGSGFLENTNVSAVFYKDKIYVEV